LNLSAAQQHALLRASERSVLHTPDAILQCEDDARAYNHFERADVLGAEGVLFTGTTWPPVPIVICLKGWIPASVEL
jgi:hypothetical protein